MSILILGQSTRLYGAISPTRTQANITIWNKLAYSDWVVLAYVSTDEYGNYSYDFTASAVGVYTIKANWTGDEYTLPSETRTLMVTSNRLSTVISISTNSSSILNGFKVELKGILQDMYGAGLKNGLIVLSYTFEGIGTWTPITSVTTNNNGEYDVVWYPTATGNFLVKAEWSGDESHLGAFATIAVSTIPYENQYVFAVESNSTISDLTFDQNSRKLSFSVSGANGTTGYARVTITKSLITDVTKVKILVERALEVKTREQD